MKLGIIGPSKVKDENKISEVAKIVADLNFDIVVTPDNGSSSEFFAKEYLNNGGKKVFEVVPLDDKEFGYDWVNLDLGDKINCGIWRNQPEKLNEETDVLLCIGYSTGVLAEIAYTKWFRKKPVYIVNELVSCKLPEEIKLDIRYIDLDKIGEELKSLSK